MSALAWSPQPGPQTALLALPDSIQDCFFGGARGGGKSAALLGDFAAHAGRYGKHAHGYLFRRTMPELEEIERLALDLFPKLWGADCYNATKHTFTAPDGADLKLRYLETDTDYLAYLGHSMTWQGFDEATSWASPEPIDKLWACLRSSTGVPCVRRLSGNPGTVGQAWVHRRYVEPAEPMTPFRYRPQPTLAPDLWLTAVFIPSKLEDNLVLMANDPSYELRLAAAGSESLFRAWRYGDWSVAVGAMYSELRDGVHRVPVVPLRWTEKSIVIDWGWEHDAVAGWFETAAMTDEPARSQMYRELVVNHMTPAAFAQRVVVGSQGEQIGRVVLDSAAWATPQDGGPSPAEQMQPAFNAAGWSLEPTVKGTGSVRNGCILLHTYFDARWDPPLLRISTACTETWRQLTAMVRAEAPQDPETPAKGQRDDAFTVVRYFVQSRPVPAAVPPGILFDPSVGAGGKRDQRQLQVVYSDRAREKKLMAVLDRPVTKKRQRPKLPWET